MDITSPAPIYVDGVRFDDGTVEALSTLGLTPADALAALSDPDTSWVDFKGATWSRTESLALVSNRSRSRVRSVFSASAITPPSYAGEPVRLTNRVADMADDLGIEHGAIVAAVASENGWERVAIGGRVLRRLGDFALVVRGGFVVDIFDAETSVPFFDDTEIDGVIITSGMYRFAHFSPVTDLDTIVAVATDPEWTFDCLDGHQVAVRGENAAVIHYASRKVRVFGPSADIVNDRLPVTHRGVTATSRVASLLSFAGTSLDEMAETITNPVAVWRGDSNLTMHQGATHTFATRYTDGLVVALTSTEDALAIKTETHIGEAYVFERVRETIDRLGARDAVARCLGAPTTSWVNEYGNTVKRGFGVEVTLTPNGEVKWFEKAASPMRAMMAAPRLAMAG